MNSRRLLISVLMALTACSADNDADRLVGQLASDRVELSAEFTDPVIARPVREGEAVDAETLLIAQDTSGIDARLREAVAAKAEMQARLDELTRGPRHEQIDAARASVDGARRDVEFQQLEFHRARDVHARGLAAAESVDRAKAALDAAVAQLAIDEARLAELLTGTTVEELRQAEQRVEQADAQIAVLETDRERRTIRAPRAGIVDSVLIEIGERPQPGMPLLVLLPGVQPHARVYVPEAQRVLVTPGSRARVYVDGLGTVIDGQVRWVASDAAFTPYFALTEHDRGRLTYAAKIDLDYDGPRLPDGVPVEVELDLDLDGE